MTDDYLTREWADNHGRLTGDLAAAIRGFVEILRVSFARLHELQFDAPWRRDRAVR